DGGCICALFTATRPDRVRSLVIYSMDPGEGTSARPPAESEAFWEELFERIDRSWGTREYASWDLGISNPAHADDEALVSWHEAHLRLSASPATADALLRNYRDTDVTGILPSIGAPTLVLHRTDNRLEPIEQSRLIARLIPNAELVELDGDDHYWVVNNDDIADEIETFLTGARPAPRSERVLSTVLFTDIVDSTRTAAQLGDERWRGVLDAHHEIVRAELDRFAGAEVDTAGDGFLATFDGPARAVRCATSISSAVERLGIRVRAGVHTGEIEVSSDDVKGIAVHIGARVAAMAGPSDVFVSQTVKDLTAGSGLVFEDAGEHELKGVPDRWRLYRVMAS
ncbi:MAG TPA: adenylate/guanylate cyclase domain-containing protein, partial [Actinomycetota bacterium]